MKQCEVIVNIEVGDIHIIKSKLNKKDTIFFTNDLAIFNKGKKLGLNIEISATYFGHSIKIIFFVFDTISLHPSAKSSPPSSRRYASI